MKSMAVSIGHSRKSKSFRQSTMTDDAFFQRLSRPIRSDETIAEYLRMKKAEQDERKDVGGFVLGELAGGRRRQDAVRLRSGITLDADNIRCSTEEVLEAVAALGVKACVYSTRKHRPTAPRCRIIIIPDRDMTPDEYEPVSRMAAKMIWPDMSIYDPTTFDLSRLMYWPSVCADGEYVWRVFDGPAAAVDQILEKYEDWRNIREWPTIAGQSEKIKRLADKQQDPTTKRGAVGAFCRSHALQDVLSVLLCEFYDPTDDPNRWTYRKGSTTAGAIVYDDLFLYSHHGTDPAGGQLVNAFDLCRIHLYGDLDEDADESVATTSLPSYKRMVRHVIDDPASKLELIKEQQTNTNDDLSQMPVTDADPNWESRLDTNDKGGIRKTTDNVMIYLQYSPDLAGKLQYNALTEKVEGITPLPWSGRNTGKEVFEWADSDDAGLRYHSERALGFRSKDLVLDATVLTAKKRSYNPIQDYLRGLTWDGVKRVETVFIDFFGDEDNEYTREVGRKFFTAAVARIMEPGIKYDTMIVISGPQGTYKSTFAERIGGKYYTALMASFKDPKAVAEILKSSWIVEIAELSAFGKVDANLIKQIISQTADEYRSAYGRNPEKHLRHCVFIGTTNDAEYLKDQTGSRRFLPIQCAGRPQKNVWYDLDQTYVDQLWAEAMLLYQLGEPLIISEAAEAIANERRNQHYERDEIEGLIEGFLDTPVPPNWQGLTIDAKLVYLSGSDTTEYPSLIKRDAVCTFEIARECLGYGARVPVKECRRIAKIMDHIPGWERAGMGSFGPGYGRQKQWKRSRKADKSEEDL